LFWAFPARRFASRWPFLFPLVFCFQKLAGFHIEDIQLAIRA
jgi:hypothetical protein